jgi:hypothetical protein
LAEICSVSYVDVWADSGTACLYLPVVVVRRVRLTWVGIAVEGPAVTMVCTVAGASTVVVACIEVGGGCMYVDGD